MPRPTTLYDPVHEHDGCGVGLVARLDGVPSHETVRRGLDSLDCMEHRGAEGADVDSGDGAGILLQMPDRFLRAVVAEELGADLPEPGRYAVAMCFLPQDEEERSGQEAVLVDAVRRAGQHVLGWRDVPVRPEAIGRVARESAPVIRQLLVAAGEDVSDQAEFERRLYVARRSAAVASGEALTVASCSSRTIVYKGMLTAPQLPTFYPELHDERMESALALVHSRFSTNTFPSWELAHPYRLIAHNGEVNTLQGNINWMRARESQLASELLGDDLEKILPVIRPDGSDSATLDNVLELLTMTGRSLPHAVMMLIPAAYEGRDDLPSEVVDFYRYHSALMEPWDGPASVTFTDGRVAGATLDRNGLRPGRWAVTTDGWVHLASEAGTLELDPATIERTGRLRPGRLFVVDLDRGEVFADGEVEREIAARQPYGDWNDAHAVRLDDLPPVSDDEIEPTGMPADPLWTRLRAFGWTEEELRSLVAPLARVGKEAVGSMGTDTPLAGMSDQAPPLFSYFKQRFAQVTNPAIDPVRESIVMSLATGVGPEGNLLTETPEHARRLAMSQPVLRDRDMAKLRHADRLVPGVAPTMRGFRAETLDCTWPLDEGPEGLGATLDRLCAEADAAVARGTEILILSDRRARSDRAAVPTLLATGAIHHHLVRAGTRLRCGLVAESGEVREVHHVACLLGYGASAVNPYLLFEALPDLVERGELPADVDLEQAEKKVIKGIGNGLLKILSKMGISTLHSYTGAQIFEALGLDEELVARYFTGTASRVGGVDLDVLAREALDRHQRAYPRAHHERAVPALPDDSGLLPTGGVYTWRRWGETHVWNPETVPLLQKAVGHHQGELGGDDPHESYAEFARRVNEDAGRRGTLRGLLRFRESAEPLSVDEVEPASEIVKRFATGAMSLGAISPESHEALAVAMNRMGGKSNTGEGGEDPARFGDERRSSIKQVASGRFGVTADYLVNADQLQIKVAQGSKPGEGGQLPGHKVDDHIAWLRHSTPGVELISPPPHHDIYSIEDLKQLIYDLRCSNPEASVSVKLVAEVGVGTVAAGVAKANADYVTIAGHDGGTGASPLSSIASAGVPWELGIAETQQTLVRHDLRGRISVQADGGMRTGRDVVVAALLGADEVGFATAPLVATGCIMMRVCHLNTCPVGIASQDPQLRERFQGTPEHVLNYFWLVAEEARGLMARLGVRTYDELIGRTDLLEANPENDHWKQHRFDVSALLAQPDAPADRPRRKVAPPPAVLDDALDHELVELAEPAIVRGEPVRIQRHVRNVNRAVGGILSSRLTRARGAEGLPDGTIRVELTGSAGQSVGAWLAPGIDLTLWGEANDYAGKGLSGGWLTARPREDATFAAEEQVIVGNTVLYGATGGHAFFRGQAGERFAVRNSGAWTVVEGVGDHGCEYMTGGRVVVLGPTGWNFAAGMSGGIAYVHDPSGTFPPRVNTELVDLDVFDDADWAALHELVSQHAERTGSPVAARLLDEWPSARHQFVKVMPRDYKRALAELARRAEEHGADVDEQREAVIT
ncbi:glutamate synthase large subunit [Egibacter rhizosphaerae]|uniref:Glutamate synthase large subunit n=1 Tax=Egibacter rhizosphaerae TaxID=1670831 RepID=A0A411YKW4_9ACTN|nr:glutamate synthase large subunit [Egibacter rhizosphaerae]QBI21821.1 glutamate synthase large subunit [Egibacter rhizosphaerae]